MPTVKQTAKLTIRTLSRELWEFPNIVRMNSEATSLTCEENVPNISKFRQLHFHRIVVRDFQPLVVLLSTDHDSCFKLSADMVLLSCTVHMPVLSMWMDLFSQ